MGLSVTYFADANTLTGGIEQEVIFPPRLEQASAGINLTSLPKTTISSRDFEGREGYTPIEMFWFSTETINFTGNQPPSGAWIIPTNQSRLDALQNALGRSEFALPELKLLEAVITPKKMCK